MEELLEQQGKQIALQAELLALHDEDIGEHTKQLRALNRRVNVLIATGAGTIAAVALFLLLVLL